MKNYAVLEGMKRQSKDVIECAFNKGYEQGYQDGKLDGEAENIEKLEKKLDDEKKAEYKRGYADGKKEVAAELNFEKGYYKGYEDGKNDIVSKAKAEVSQYREGYDKGLKHGQELRIEEAECAEACGMKRAWQAVRKIMYMSLFDLDELFPGWDVEHIIEKLSASEVIEKIEAWEAKKDYVRNATTKEQSDIPKVGDEFEWLICSKDLQVLTEIDRGEYTLVDVEGHKHYASSLKYYRKTGRYFDSTDDFIKATRGDYKQWIPKQNVPETNVENIEVGDEVKDNFGNKLLVTHVYSECRYVDTIDTDGRVERFPSECLKKTGRRYCFQELLDAIKSEKLEEGGENVHE